MQLSLFRFIERMVAEQLGKCRAFLDDGSLEHFKQKALVTGWPEQFCLDFIGMLAGFPPMIDSELSDQFRRAFPRLVEQVAIRRGLVENLSQFTAYVNRFSFEGKLQVDVDSPAGPSIHNLPAEFKVPHGAVVRVALYAGQ